VAVYVPVKFRFCTSIYGWVIKLCPKKQNGGRRDLELPFVDHPRSLLHGPNIVLKFHVNRITTVGDMAILTFGKFGLKRLFPPRNLRFLGVLPPKHYFSSSRPPKGTSLAETASYELLSVAIGWGVSSGRRDKNTKKGSPDEVTNWVSAPPTPLIRS